MTIDIDQEVGRFAALKKKQMQDLMKEKNKDIAAFKDRMRTAGNVTDLVNVYRRYLESQGPEEEGDDSNADDDVGESSKPAAPRHSRTTRASAAAATTTAIDAATDNAGDESESENSMSAQIDVESERSLSRSTFPPNDKVNWPDSFSASEQATVRKYLKKYLSDKPLLYTRKVKQDDIYEAAHDLADGWPLPFGKVTAVAQLAFFDVVCKRNSWKWPYFPSDEAATNDEASSQGEDEGTEGEDAEETAPKQGGKAAGKRPRETAARIGHKATSASSGVNGSRKHSSTKIAAMDELSAVEEDEEDEEDENT
ncbi:hypothetical protein PtrSN002B_005363 [Pyrenophora tritici-repentis]|nr:hypothetical protein PtrSN001C_007403 [Pyrenophora tritici-repentis]KAI1537294.1 hypothetical protein PtrSN001A_005306 [Pyrenophora tritici-repentis]KAI1551991.1 hypothetical protein PtrSN002B_005363 [Pyrenophora tritici-repentis]KAI1566170.1 hypothetical protein PtrEW4_007798 [Pyrenophora tritici-repentis]KAI1590707.1 hypothetical protein PtrEW13061_005197 [Pyrenophora tritici-repentis]